ncbi:hypothetical protein GUJ93_ZPchr0006g40759 [Zizania palustris]|uniref:Uncharacterized protein n=1 Tax=Zizania palustris TaxID=103762 RepID=A0A8J5T5X8_ZIZPA|nr:hypothetical protein GUJ93_ZPchr0006g40759 [Zizania palustris]
MQVCNNSDAVVFDYHLQEHDVANQLDTFDSASSHVSDLRSTTVEAAHPTPLPAAAPRTPSRRPPLESAARGRRKCAGQRQRPHGPRQRRRRSAAPLPLDRSSATVFLEA